MPFRYASLVRPSPAGEVTEELRRVLGDVSAEGLAEQGAEWLPPLDVYESDQTVEIVVDLAGVQTDGVRIVAAGDTVLIAGIKAPREPGDAAFHLAERSYGRFARAVRLTAACDTGRGTAILANGELRVILPRILDRRGSVVTISVAAAQTTS